MNAPSTTLRLVALSIACLACAAAPTEPPAAAGVAVASEAEAPPIDEAGIDEAGIDEAPIDEPDEPVQPADAAALARLEAEYAEAHEAWRAAIAAGDAAARRELVAHPPARAFEPRFRALADAGEPGALAWLLREADTLRSSVPERRALRVELCTELVERHAASPWFREHGLATLGRERAGLGDAYVPLLLALADRADRADGPDEVRAKVAALAAAARALSASPDEQDRAHGLALYERILAEEPSAPGVPALRAEYLRRKHLRVGMTAPDFAFATPAGERHTLGELRGKVVLIDFWGLWCPQCMTELPALKELDARFAGQPFALLGVATDADPAAFAEKTAALGVTWLQAWDGGKRGTIATAWGIDEFPTKLLLDREGRVRHFNPRTSELGSLIEALLREDAERAR